MARLTDRSNMTLDVYRGRKTTTTTTYSACNLHDGYLADLLKLSVLLVEQYYIVMSYILKQFSEPRLR